MSKVRGYSVRVQSKGDNVLLRQVLKKIEPSLISLYKRMSDPPSPNLKGDRDIEFSWIAAHMPQGPGSALDFGSGSTYLGLIAARRGFSVSAIDLQPNSWYYTHPNLEFLQTSVFDLELKSENLDLIINCSSVEHVGMGRYGDPLADKGDLQAMEDMCSLLRHDGIMLLTVPIGQDAVFAGSHRVYGSERLPRLLSGYIVDKEEYWVKDENNRWVEVSREMAVQRPSHATSYGLGCFLLSKS